MFHDSWSDSDPRLGWEPDVVVALVQACDSWITPILGSAHQMKVVSGLRE